MDFLQIWLQLLYLQGAGSMSAGRVDFLSGRPLGGQGQGPKFAHSLVCARLGAIRPSRKGLASSTSYVLPLQGPFTYEALRPEEINFVPLKQKKTYQSRQLLEVTSLVSCLSKAALL